MYKSETPNLSTVLTMSNAIMEELNHLRAAAGSTIEILVDPTDPTFQKYATRWTDIDRKTPAAIMLPSNEKEIKQAVSKSACRILMATCAHFADMYLGAMGSQCFDSIRNEKRWA